MGLRNSQPSRQERSISLWQKRIRVGKGEDFFVLDSEMNGHVLANVQRLGAFRPMPHRERL